MCPACPGFGRLAGRIGENPEAKPAEIIGTITQQFSQAARLFVARASDTEDPHAYAAFLAEELAIGDMEDAIDTYRAQLKQPEAMTPDEYDMLFQTVASLQKDLAARRLAHAQQGI